MKIPISIEPCPIIEAIIEVRIDTKTPGEAILGVVYNEFKTDYPNIEKLPILQIPEQFRSSDPNLRYKPYYQLKNDQTIIQIGTKVVSFVNVGKYLGWPTFSEKAYNVFERLYKDFEIEKTHRVAVRYVNLFNNTNIFDRLKLQIVLNQDDFSDNEINLVANIHSQNCINRLSIANRANVLVNNKMLTGSIVDIDTVIKTCPNDVHTNISAFKKCIEQAHNEEKELFYKLLREDYVATLNPKY